jgi:phosphoglycolate phosphatase
MIKYCIFDLDGTILDTISTITHYVNKMLDHKGLEHITEAQAKIFAGNGAYMLIKRTLAHYGITDEGEIAEALGFYLGEYDASPLYLTRPFPGMCEALLKLKAAGVHLGVVSNKQHAATLPAVRHFFGDIFEGISGAIDGVPVKPAKDLPLRVLGEMGGSPEECAFVGDTYVDMETGKNLGAARTVGVLWGFRDKAELVCAGADITIDRVEELPEAVQGE